MPIQFHESPDNLPQPQRQFTVVLDIDRTLVSDPVPHFMPSPSYALQMRPAIRPGAYGLLRALHEGCGFEVVLWSAGTEEHVRTCVGLLDPPGSSIDHVIYRSAAWMTDGVPVVKDLARLQGRCCVIADDQEAVRRTNPSRAILVAPYIRPDPGDCALQSLQEAICGFNFGALPADTSSGSSTPRERGLASPDRLSLGSLTLPKPANPSILRQEINAQCIPALI